MTILHHATLPQDFAAPANRIILAEPQPEYFWARIAFAAASRAELEMQGYDFGFAEHKIADGGAPYPQELTSLMLGASPMAAAINTRIEIGKHVGDTIEVERPNYTGGGYTKAARAIGAHDTISTEGIPITDSKAKMTLERYVGPYKTGGSEPQPYVIDNFGSVTVRNSMAQKVGHHMRRDRMKFVNAVMMDHFSRGEIIYTNPNHTNINDYTTATSGLLDVDTCWRVEEEMRSDTDRGNIPPFSNGRYLMAATPTQTRQLKGDPHFGEYAAEERDANPLYQLIARIGLLDVVEVSQVKRQDNTSSIQIEYAVVLGPGSVGHAIARHPGVANSDNTNYGEQARVVWIAYEAMETLDNRFQRRIATTNDSPLTFNS